MGCPVAPRSCQASCLPTQKLRYAAKKYGVALDAGAQRELVAAWEHVLPYPDAVPALEALAAAGIRCSVLTNGTPATSERAMANAGISGLIDSLLSVESVGQSSSSAAAPSL